MFIGVRSTVGVQYEVDKRYGNVPIALATRWTYHCLGLHCIQNGHLQSFAALAGVWMGVGVAGVGVDRVVVVIEEEGARE
jgi:hypothetical protein